MLAVTRCYRGVRSDSGLRIFIYLFIQLRLLLLKYYKYHAQINLMQQRYQPITAAPVNIKHFN